MRLMKHLSFVVGCAMLTSMPLFAAEAKVKGEIVDQACYLKDKAKMGAEHKDCGTGCIKKGMAAALVTADGEIYTIAGPYTENKNAKLVEFVAQTVEATGEVTEKDGKKILTAKGIIAVK